MKFLAASSMSDAEEDVSVDTTSSISSYMEIDVDEDPLCVDLTARSAFGCPIILTCNLYDYDDYADTPYEVEIRLEYDSVLGSMGTCEDWAEVSSYSELEKASSTDRNIRLTGDISSTSSISLSKRTHLDLNGYTLSSSETDINGRARIENGKISGTGDGIVIYGTEIAEIWKCDVSVSGYGIKNTSSGAMTDVYDCSIQSDKCGAFENGSSSSMTLTDCKISSSGDGVDAYCGQVEIEGGEINVAGHGIYACNCEVSVSSCSIKSSSSNTECAGIFSSADPVITVSDCSIEGPVGVLAYDGTNAGIITIKDSSVTSTVGWGLEAGVESFSGIVNMTNVTISSADSGVYCGSLSSESEINLTDCTVTGTTYATYQSGGTLTVSGGTLSGPDGCYCSGGITNLQDSCSVTATDSSSGSAAYAAGGTINATGCTLAGYYGVRQSSGSIDIENCSVTGSSYGIYISGQDSEPIIQYDDFVDCSNYAVYNSSSSRTVEAYWCYTGGNDNDAGYEDAEDRSVNVYCYPSYPESVTVSPDSSEIFTGGETQTTATASVALKNSKLSYETQGYYTPAYSWSSSNTSVATVAGSGKTATITSVGAGTCDIICTAYDANGNAVMIVSRQIKSVTVSFGRSPIYTGGTTSTTATASLDFNSGSSYSGSYTWTSSNTGVATVSASTTSSNSVTITSVGAGTSTITCTVDGVDGVASMTVELQVPTSVSSTAGCYILATENYPTTTATASVTMNSGSYSGTYTWSSSNSNIVSVSGSGSSVTLTAKATGTATITCSVALNGTTKSGTFSIEVGKTLYRHTVNAQYAYSTSTTDIQCAMTWYYYSLVNSNITDWDTVVSSSYTFYHENGFTYFDYTYAITQISSAMMMDSFYTPTGGTNMSRLTSFTSETVITVKGLYEHYILYDGSGRLTTDRYDYDASRTENIYEIKDYAVFSFTDEVNNDISLLNIVYESASNDNLPIRDFDLYVAFGKRNLRDKEIA